MNKITTVNNQVIQSHIYTIRNQQVRIDRDLVELYGVESKCLNEQVKQNIERFPKEFRFQLTEIEKNELVANCDRFQMLKYFEEDVFGLKKKIGEVLMRNSYYCHLTPNY